MRNPALEPLDVLVGEWGLTLTDSWFLESRDVKQEGRAFGRWLGDAFIELEAELEGAPTWHFIFGRSDASDEIVALYHDPRPMSRVFAVDLQGTELTLLRQDPDFHQRFVATVGSDRIDGRTWRKDFDLIFERVAR